MARIHLTDSAMRHLVADPKIGGWRNRRSDGEVPTLGYYRRSYFTAKDGTVTEYGDGFMLTFDRPDLDWATQGLVNQTVPVTNGFNVLVVGPKTIFSADFTIDWANGKYNYEPQRPI